MKSIFSLSAIFFLSIFSILNAQNSPLQSKDAIKQQKWVDSIYNNMSLEQKVGQLFMVRAFSNQSQAHVNSIAKLINENHIGGLIFSSGGPVRQAQLNNLYQAISKTPLLIGMDAEWGLSMRLDSTYAFPWNMTLGAIKDDKLIEETGRYIGEHCKRIGVHFNFAPDVDINTNPKNPIIGNRSFGEDRDNVTAKGLAFMKGMQEAGVLANAKHFPGHGYIKADSHLQEVIDDRDLNTIQSTDILPFKALINKGISGIMPSHVIYTSCDSVPASFSRFWLQDQLRHQLNFDGVIFEKS